MTSSNKAGTNLSWRGGPVLHQPLVFLVFWGKYWVRNGADVQNYLRRFYAGLGTDKWTAILNQYGDPASPDLGHESLLTTMQAGVLVDARSEPPSSATEDQLASEAGAVLGNYVWQGNEKWTRQIIPIVITPIGHRSAEDIKENSCAHHNWGQFTFSDGGAEFFPWAVLPDQQDPSNPCRDRTLSLDIWSVVGGHEAAEAIVDPFLNSGQFPGSGWADSNGSEVADKCQGTAFKLKLSTGTFFTQELWDNRTSKCRKSS